MANESAKLATPTQKRWAVIRVAFGTAQVCGAMVSALLLLELGSTSALTLGATAVTAALLLTSVTLFRFLKLAG